MPRLSADHYLKRYRILHNVWRSHDIVFGHLSYADQRSLHSYYRPSEALTRNQLLEHRKAAADDPNLTQAAGQAYRSFHALVTKPRVRGAGVVVLRADRRQRALRAIAIARPTLDVLKLATALIATASLMDAHSVAPARAVLSRRDALRPEQLPDTLPGDAVGRGQIHDLSAGGVIKDQAGDALRSEPLPDGLRPGRQGSSRNSSDGGGASRDTHDP